MGAHVPRMIKHRVRFTGLTWTDIGLARLLVIVHGSSASAPEPNRATSESIGQMRDGSMTHWDLGRITVKLRWRGFHSPPCVGSRITVHHACERDSLRYLVLVLQSSAVTSVRTVVCDCIP